MTEWILFLPPLLVLPIVLLFRFVGCGEQLALAQPDPAPTPQPTPTPAPTPTPPPDTEKRGPPPRYRDYILGLDLTGDVIDKSIVPNGADVVAYWRLIDDPKPASRSIR